MESTYARHHETRHGRFRGSQLIRVRRIRLVRDRLQRDHGRRSPARAQRILGQIPGQRIAAPQMDAQQILVPDGTTVPRR